MSAAIRSTCHTAPGVSYFSFSRACNYFAGLFVLN